MKREVKESKLYKAAYKPYTGGLDRGQGYDTLCTAVMNQAVQDWYAYVEEWKEYTGHDVYKLACIYRKLRDVYNFFFGKTIRLYCYDNPSTVSYIREHLPDTEEVHKALLHYYLYRKYRNYQQRTY